MIEDLPRQVLDMVRDMASFDKKLRDRAVAALKAYFEQKSIPHSVLQDSSMYLIWKGLHGAMLNQDQPLLQEKLADTISSMVHSFKRQKAANTFVQQAIETFAREWDRVNVFMANKMMMFFRRVFRQALFRLADNNFKHVDSFVKMLENTIIRPTDHENDFPMVAKMFLCSIYMEEMAKSATAELSHDKIMLFLSPYIKVLAVTKQQNYVQDVNQNVFQYLIRQSDLGVDNRADMLDNEIVVEGRKRIGAPSTEEEEVDEEEEQEVEEEEEEEVEDEGSNDDEDVEMEDDSDDDEEEYPLDPRAGNVNVVLPQLAVDYDPCGEHLQYHPQSALSSQLRCTLQLLKRILSSTSGQRWKSSQCQSTIQAHPAQEPPEAQEDVERI